ncbi:hypothetical protein [Parabacteroides sp. Marseille-P3160]|uniref:hypothetical protein n=1 Tax=Parabacteroides sp. Marseille-P3160 TaxID=1917887 RepID=UPI0009BADA71|nr:hypothetical protein [Parabacteroides sp. Marseille-P3160]
MQQVINSQKSFPEKTIFNNNINVKLYLPDINRGYYKGTRFDWSGIIYKMEYKNHQYFSEWFEKYDPKAHDAICGPVDEFSPIGYNEAHVDGEFLKIGVGTLRKPKETNYNRFSLYEIMNAGIWNISHEDASITFRHVLQGNLFSYVYTKVIKLLNDEFLLEYTLENTGTQFLSTDVYNHHFFTIDRHPTGPDIVINLSFNPKGKWRDADGPAIIRNERIEYNRCLYRGESVFMDNVYGFDPEKDTYSFKIENRCSRAGVRMTGNQKLLKMVFWASSTTSCLEPYIGINVAPGEKINWINKYELYEF